MWCINMGLSPVIKLILGHFLVPLVWRPPHCMKRYPSWEVNSPSASKEIICISQNPKVYYYVHRSLPLLSILSQLIQSKPFHSISPRLISVSSFHLCLGLHKWKISFRFPYWNPVWIHFTHHMPQQTHCSWFPYRNNICRHLLHFVHIVSYKQHNTHTHKHTTKHSNSTSVKCGYI